MTDLGLIWCPVNIMLKPSATLINRPLRPSEYRFRLLSPPKLGEVPEGGRGLFPLFTFFPVLVRFCSEQNFFTDPSALRAPSPSPTLDRGV